MNIVILGAGRVGCQIAQTLVDNNNHVILIERNRQRALRVQNRLDCKVIIDEGTRSDVLEIANIKNTDYFVAATNSDEVNLIACSIAKKLSNKVRCIARIRSKAYMQSYGDVEEIFHVDYIVYPEREAALSIIKSIEYGGGVSDVFTFKDFKSMIMRNFIVSPDSLLVGQKLKDIISITNIPANFIGKFLVTLINRGGESIIPSGDVVIAEGDELFILGAHAMLDSLYTYLGKKSKGARNIRKIMIIGAGEVGTQLLDCYLNTQDNNIVNLVGKRRFATRDITIVENDLQKCRQLADVFHDVTILHANVSEENILEEIELSSFDMVICATDMQERNIVLAAHSHNLGVKNTIALVDSQVYSKIALELGIDVSLSVKDEVTESITNYLGGQQSLYSIIDGSYEIFRCTIDKDSKFAYSKVIDINLPNKSILLCVNSKKHGPVIISGNTILEPEDIILCLAPTDMVSKVRDIFELDKIEENNIALG